ncbi:phage tail sheath family protein [Dapis sp. BLCC M229]|uniref:phage tail sheath family protein n=1 Tax=Dapis sp. BLCC M229 TaxID=3400188 RepID=UPI003CFABF76
MPTYFSPGVYVEEISSGSAPITGLSTSTAGFIGVVSDSINIPISPLMQVSDEFLGSQGVEGVFNLKNFPVNIEANAEVIIVDQKTKNYSAMTIKPEYQEQMQAEKKAKITIESAPTETQIVKVQYIVESVKVTNEVLLTIPQDADLSTQTEPWERNLKKYPVNTDSNTYNIKANGSITRTNVKISNDDDVNKVATVTIPVDWIKNNEDLYDKNTKKTKTLITITADYQQLFPTFTPVGANEVKLCTNFNEFKKYFGDFSTDERQKQLAHAVYGFFNNGGSRCYVSRVTDAANIRSILEKFEAIDEIAIVAAPGITDAASRSAIVTHCQNMGDRFAILDCTKDKTPSNVNEDKPDNSDYAAYYFPWIQVSDPLERILNPNGKGEDFYTSVPPSGHIAGVYARVDAQRGVHKAPANEVISGALGLDYKVTKNQQDGLNPDGINCIRELNGNIRIWGARTVGGDANGEFKYINVRRLFLSLRDSIDKGTQWTVFEPNDAELWGKIRRNVNAYLTNVWRSGALFGATPQEAFYVKCDAENNPPEVRDLGQVIIEIGVAPVKPAEFVIFRLSQWSGS